MGYASDLCYNQNGQGFTQQQSGRMHGWIDEALSGQLVEDEKPYRGGELRTQDSFTHGRFEVRMKSAPGSGIVSSFFTYHDYWDEGYNDTQYWNEIDWEILGRYDNQVQTNYITEYENQHDTSFVTDFNPHDEFHVYAFEWTPDYVAYFVDGLEVRYEEGGDVDLLNRHQKIMMNIWQPTSVNWAGEMDDQSLSAYAIYDWVKYYYYSPGEGSSGTDNNFSLGWDDNFNHYDEGRWQKATHTWDQNNASFTDQNVVFDQGYMILCLTTPDDQGYDGGYIEDNSSDIVINEIYYNPPSEQGSDSDFEFVELYNRGTEEVNLSGYYFTQGFNYTFPDSSYIAPGEYAVLTHDINYGGDLNYDYYDPDSDGYMDNGAKVYSGFQGSVSNLSLIHI